MNNLIETYNQSLKVEDKKICDVLAKEINSNLPEAESKIWHGHPVWFLDENPIVGYSKLKDRVQLLFWSGQSFNESKLEVVGSLKFKAAGYDYTSMEQINKSDIAKWIKKAKKIQWNYKDVVKNRGVLEKLK